MKTKLLTLLTLASLAWRAVAQTTVLTINTSTGLINVPAGVAPNFSALKLGGTTLGSLYQPLDSDLTLFAAITPSSNVQSLLGAANYAGIKTLLGLNNVENTALSAWAGSTSITTLGTIATGTWSATAIGTSKGGVPAGGTIGQVLTKQSSTSYDTAWATPGGGGAAIDHGGIAWIESVANGGNDTTGVVGDPSKTYATIQAAFDDGARVFWIGPGAKTGDLSVPFFTGSLTVYSAYLSSDDVTPAIGAITAAGSLIIGGNGADRVNLGTISAAGTVRLSGVRLMDAVSAGGDGIQMERVTAHSVVFTIAGNFTAIDSELLACTVDSVNAVGRGGTWGGTTVNCNGKSPGANGGEVEISHVSGVGDIYVSGATGADAIDDGLGTPSAGAAGGAGGSIALRYVQAGSLYVLSGLGGAGVNGGNTGAESAAGTASLFYAGIQNIDGGEASGIAYTIAGSFYTY